MAHSYKHCAGGLGLLSDRQDFTWTPNKNAPDVRAAVSSFCPKVIKDTGQ